jgi:hypothetical protein
MKRIAIVLLVLALGLSSCAAKSSSQTANLVDKSSESGGYPAEMPMAPAMDSAVQAPAAEAPGSNYSSGVQGAEVERLVIKNANLSIIVKDPAKAMDEITKMADTMGGWVVTSNLYKTTTADGIEIPQATINIRIPSDSLNDALAKVKALVDNPETDIRSENVSGEDVTSTYTDLKSRLTNLEQAEASLREIMASATKTEDVLSVFNQLTQVRSDIEVIKGQMKYYEESAHFSAINIELISQESVKPITVAGWQPVGVARDALQSLINFGKGLVNVGIWFIILVIPILLVLYVGIRILIWIIKKLFPGKKKAAPVVVAPQPEEVKPEPTQKK